jgi:hypothetical protein
VFVSSGAIAILHERLGVEVAVVGRDSGLIGCNPPLKGVTLTPVTLTAIPPAAFADLAPCNDDIARLGALSEHWVLRQAAELAACSTMQGMRARTCSLLRGLGDLSR